MLGLCVCWICWEDWGAMAKTLEETQNKRKTRVSSSDESLISKTSPETKKSRSSEHAVCFHKLSEQDAEDVILYTLDMTEDFRDTLRTILKKLDKLDSIEKSMNDFQATLLKLEGCVQSLESCHTMTRRDVDDIKERY